jgi:hypothetical protein
MAKKRQNDALIWKERIERSKKVRKEKLKDAKKYVQFYKGNQWIDKKTIFKEKPVVNLIFPHVKSQIPSLYFQNPKWFVRPTGKDALDWLKNAQVAEYYLNHYANYNLGSSIKKHIRAAILDAFFMFGVIKTGYVPDIEVNDNYGKFKIKGYDDSNNEIYETDKSGNFIKDEDEEIISSDKFFCKRRSPAAFLFDLEEETFIDEGRYIIEQIHTSYKSFMKDKKYTNKSELKASYSVKSGLDLDDKTLRRKDGYDELVDDIKRLVIYEIYDIFNDEIICVSDGSDEIHRKDSTPDGVDKHPYSFLYFNLIPDEIYPMSDIKPLKPIQEEYNIGQAMINTHAKRFGRKYVGNKSVFGDDNWEKLKDPEDGTLIDIKADLPLNKYLDVVPDATLDPAVFQYFVAQKENFWQVGGANEYDRGGVERRKTAYEASKISQGSEIRKEDRRSLVEDFAQNIGWKLLYSMQHNMSVGDAINIGGQGKAANWIQVQPDDIKGKFVVSVEVGSTSPKIPENERADFMQFIQILPTFPPEVIQTKVNFNGLFNAFARMFSTFTAEEILNDETQEAAAKKKMMQQQMIQNAIANMGNVGPSKAASQPAPKGKNRASV